MALPPKSLAWLAVFFIAAAGIAAVGLRGSAGSDPKAGAEPGFGMKRGPFEVAVAASGIIQPIEVVDVGAQVSGQLAMLHVRLGDRVEPGQLLAEIDDRLIRARLMQGEAAAENLRAQIEAKKAQVTYARAQQTRTDALAERHISTRAQADLAQSTTAVLVAEARALEAQLAGQLAALNGIRLDLDYTRITAPVDGVVTAILAQRGQTLNANQQAPIILRISRDRPLTLVARIPEADFERVQPGMNARFTLLGGSSRTYEGKVSTVLRAPTIINDVVFYDAIILLNNDQGALAFGRTTQVFIEIERLSCAVMLPRNRLPDSLTAGTTVKLALRRQGGNVVTRVLPIKALNELWAAIPCHDADKAGLEAADRVLSAAIEPRVDG
jgi:macrolide-specific efflux system membrane fusion protein